MRKSRVADYNPPPLHGFTYRIPEGSEGYEWTRTNVQAVPEYVMGREKFMSVAYEENGFVRFRVDESLSRRLCPPKILADLDRDNWLTG